MDLRMYLLKILFAELVSISCKYNFQKKKYLGQGFKSNKWACFMEWKFLKVSCAMQELIYIVFCALLA